MRHFLYTLAAVVLLAISPTLLSQPYSFVKSHDTGARYVKLQRSDDRLFAISESNYIDLYHLNQTAQSEPVKRLLFSDVVAGAVYSSGHLVVGFYTHLNIYQLDANDNLTLIKRVDIQVFNTHDSLTSAGSYLVVNQSSKVELLKWSDGNLSPLRTFTPPTTSHTVAVTAIDEETLVVDWADQTNKTTSVIRHNIANNESQLTEFPNQINPLLMSVTERLGYSTTGTLGWYEFQQNAWQLRAEKTQATYIYPKQWFRKDNKLFLVNYNISLPGKMLEYKLENNSISSNEYWFESEQYCSFTVMLATQSYCLADDHISPLDTSNQTPKMAQPLALFAPASKALASTATQLLQLSGYQLRSTPLQNPDLSNSSATLKVPARLRIIDTFRDQILLNNGASFVNLKNNNGSLTLLEQTTHSSLDSNNSTKNWFAPGTLITVDSTLKRLQFYKTDTEQFLLSSPSVLLWENILLPANKQITSVQELHYSNNYLILKLVTKTNQYEMYAVRLNPATYQPLAPAQLLTDDQGKKLWSSEIHSDGTSLILHHSVINSHHHLVLLEMLETQIQYRKRYDLAEYNGCLGSFSKSSGPFLMLSATTSSAIGSEYCLFEHQAGELRLIQNMPAPGYSWLQSGFTFTQASSTLVAATGGDGRTAFYQKNYAPLSQQILNELPEDSSSELVAQSQDLEDEVVQLQLLEAPQHGEVSIHEHQLFYKPEANFFGTDQWVVKSTDPHGNFTEERHEITVTAVNDAPELQGTDHFTLLEDTPFTEQLNATDIEQHTVSFLLAHDGQLGKATITPAGLLSYTPTENLFGQDQLEVQLTDSEGASRVETITLQIEPVNDLPQLQQLSLNGTEDQTLVAELQIIDPDSDIGSIELIEPSLHGSATFSGTTLTYQPKPDFNGTELLKLRLNDSAGGNTETSLTLHIAAVNDAPFYTGAMVYEVAEDSSLLIALTAQDKENQQVQFSLQSSATLGVAQLSAAGELRYIPHPDLSGEEKLTIQLTDAEQASSTVQLTIKIVAVNDLPQLKQVSFSVAEDAELSVTLEIVDVDSAPGSIELVQSASHGAATLTGVTLLYKPVANYHGQDKIKLRLNDSMGGSSEVEVQLQVTSVNDAPVLAAQSFSLTTGSSRSLQLTATDVENDPLSYNLLNSATLGTAGLSAAGLLSYTATTAGTENLTIEVKDAGGATTQATVTITITTPPPLPPPAESGGSLGWPALALLLLCYSRRRYNKL